MANGVPGSLDYITVIGRADNGDGMGMRIGTVVAAVWIVLAGVGVQAADTLAALEANIGQPLDLVELGTGKRFVRPKLDKVTKKGDSVESIRIIEEGQTRPITLRLTAITRIDVGRETVYEGEVSVGGFAAKKAEILREKHATAVAESQARMKARGVAPWPELSAEEHAAEVKDLKTFAERVREAFPRLSISETHEFIMVTDMPKQEIGPYVASLDSMHDFLCDLYGIPRGEPVWKGKCLVFAFLSEEDFVAFEGRFMGSGLAGAHGVCHSSSDGRVIMACHRGPMADAFAHMLVHETSHGFNHRWMSPQRLPNWLNEGIAEWVGTQVVPHSRQVPLKEAQSFAFMQQTGSLGPSYLTRANIDAIQYGISSALVKFLVKRDRKKFAEFVRGIKEGMTAEESLQASYKGSISDLVAAFGVSIGIPNLKP